MTKLKLTLALSALCLTGTVGAQITNPAPYCNASFDDGVFNVPDAIKSVTLGTLSNNSGGQYAAPHYVFYNNLAAPNLTAGSSVPMTVTFEVNGGCGYGVWIDFNQNNTFEPNEKVAGSTANGYLNLGASVPVTANIAIPGNAIAGNTRMRVRIVEDDDYTMVNGANILPCNLSTSATDVMDWGETEDYKVNIVTGGGTTQKPVAAFTPSATMGFANTTLFTFTDNSTNAPTTRMWSFTPNNVAFQNGTSATATNPIVKFTAAGSYSVKLVVSNTAGKDSIVKTNLISITPAQGINDINQGSVSVYPNPVTNAIHFTQSFASANLQLVDMSGIIKVSLPNFTGNKVDVSELANGIYQLRVIGKDIKVNQTVNILR